MARYIDLGTERVRIKTELAEDPNSTRQYAVILPNTLAMRMIDICSRDSIQPSKWMRETITEKLDQDNYGLRMTLDEPTRAKLDIIASIYGISREGALQVFMAEYLEDFAEHVASRRKSTESRYKELVV